MKKKCAGFMLLNALLGIFLLASVIYLIMHTMTQYHAEQNAEAIGAELVAVVAELLINNPGNLTNGPYTLVPSNTGSCGSNHALVTNIPSGYLQSLKISGFDLASSACVVVSG